MVKDHSISVKDAVLKLQLSLLEGIQNEDQLFAAGSVMCRSDYDDVVTERSIANLCGYPLCCNSLPCDRPRKGHYRISLRERKIYDLHETYMYCSVACVVNSRAFAGILQEERCSVLNQAKLNEILSLYENLDLNREEVLGENEDLGLAKVTIHEKAEANGGEVSLDDWIGPSDAIEGYIPQRDRIVKPSPSKCQEQGSKSTSAKTSGKKDLVFSEVEFMTSTITSDEYFVTKAPTDSVANASSAKCKETKGDLSCKHVNLEEQFSMQETSSAMANDNPERKFTESQSEGKNTVTINEIGMPPASSKNDSRRKMKEVKGKRSLSNEIRAGQVHTSYSCQTGHASTLEEEKEHSDQNTAKPSKTVLKSSLKTSGAKKTSGSVTWADERTDSLVKGNLCEARGLERIEDGSSVIEGGEDSMIRYVSAEVCAMALSKAAEAVESGNSDALDAVSKAGIIILPSSHDGVEEDPEDNIHKLQPVPSTSKWPEKTENAHSDLVELEESWFDEPPEGFSLTLSPFATMWMSLFGWMTSSSLAYIYGREARFHAEFSSVNGREYPQKIVLEDGRSSEIKKTLAGCLSRALPGLLADLRLPITLSSLEQGMACLLDTMSFTDAIPAFRMRQWQVVVLLFVDSLSVCRIPALTSHMTNRRALLRKLLDGARISAEEYELMTDFIIPLGRAPQFSTRCGA